MKRQLALMGLVVACAGALASGQAPDLQQSYGTRTVEAARRIDAGIKLADAKKWAEALQSFQAALALEPTCQMALYWKGHVQCDMGDMDAGMAAMAEAFEVNPRTNVAVECAIDLGISHGKLDRAAEAKKWLTKAVLLDPTDRYQMQWKAYRNLAVVHAGERDFLAAVLSALTARRLNPAQVEQKMLEELDAKARTAPGSGRILWLDEPAATVKPSDRPPATTMPDVTDSRIPKGMGRIIDLLADSTGSHVVGTCEPNQHHFWLITLDPEQSARKIDLDVGKILDVEVAGDSVYLATDNPPGVRQVKLASGQTVRTWPLDAAPSSLAVFPARRRIFVSIQDRVHAINMLNGAVEAATVSGTRLSADPQEQYLLSLTSHTDSLGGGGTETIIVDGRPIIIQRPGSFRVTRFFATYLVTPRKLVMAEFSEKAADLVFASPDGEWLTRAGRDPEVALFHRGNLTTAAATFKQFFGGGPLRINPVTGQAAVADSRGLHIFDTGRPETQLEVPGAFTSCVWTGDGRHLVAFTGRRRTSPAPRPVPRPRSGVTPTPDPAARPQPTWGDEELVVLANRLTDAEYASRDQWVKTLLARSPIPTTGPDDALIAQPLAGLDKFHVSANRTLVQAALTQAISRGRTVSPLHWEAYEPYCQPEDGPQAVREVIETVKRKDGGVAIYKAQQLLSKAPDYAPGLYALARALDVNGQTPEAIAQYEKAIQADAGRTSLTPQALVSMSEMLSGAKRDLEALHCLAVALQLDRESPQLRGWALPLLNQMAFATEAKFFGAGAQTPVIKTLPRLPMPPAAAKLNAQDIYRRAAEAIVLVQAGGRSGTGFCVGEVGLILTNEHVVQGSANARITAFRYVADKLARLPEMTAQVIYTDSDTDLAVLRITPTPSRMIVLPVVAIDPRPGEKVYAIGNPGMGDRILEQTISEGIVSAEARVIDRQPYIQHTAPINPGNSGGPLLNDRAQVVGMVTLKAHLENVGFAIPASRIRQIFQNASKP